MSTMLVNTYISKIPTPTLELKLISYADDCTILTSGREVLEVRLNGYLPVLRHFLADRNLTPSAPESKATIFTTWTREVRKVLDIKIVELVIPTTDYPNILGVTFSKHVEDTVARLKSRNKIVKAITGSTWGRDNQTLLDKYKPIGCPLIRFLQIFKQFLAPS